MTPTWMLIVEDDRATREEMRRLLRTVGHPTVTTATVADAPRAALLLRPPAF